jgi:hypothetical protein
MSRQGVIAWALASVAGCGGGFSDQCERFAQLSCQRSQDCGAITAAAAAACVTATRAACPCLASYIDRHVLTYNASFANICLSWIPTASCDQVKQVGYNYLADAHCDQLLGPTGSAGLLELTCLLEGQGGRGGTSGSGGGAGSLGTIPVGSPCVTGSVVCAPDSKGCSICYQPPGAATGTCLVNCNPFGPNSCPGGATCHFPIGSSTTSGLCGLGYCQ